HVELSSVADLLLAVAVRLAQAGEKRRLGPPARDAAAVLVEETFVGLALEIPVGSGQLARHHQAGLDDVLNQLQRRARRLGRAEGEILVGKVADLVDDSLPGVLPGLQGFLDNRPPSRHALSSANGRVYRAEGRDFYFSSPGRRGPRVFG